MFLDGAATHSLTLPGAASRLVIAGAKPNEALDVKLSAAGAGCEVHVTRGGDRHANAAGVVTVSPVTCN